MARIALIVADRFEDTEFRVPFDTLRKAGHQVDIIGIEAGRDVSAEPYAALLIPGGYSPDHLRMDPDIVGFVRQFVDAGKPVAAICHAPWMLAEADVIRGRSVTSWPSIKTDLVNAGAKWIDREVVEDGNIITSRKPDDLQALQAILRRIGGEDPTFSSRMAPADPRGATPAR